MGNRTLRLLRQVILAGWSCSHCGTWNSDTASSCQGCGK
jgi:hypothetical protein